MRTPLSPALLSLAIAVALCHVPTVRADDVDTTKDEKKVTALNGMSVDAQGATGTVDGQRLSTGVTTVMSKQQIDAIPTANSADGLSHLPGLSSYSDMHLGQAATGESEYVTIRGLDSSYNSYTLNGFALPETDSSTRAISLNMLAPFGIQSVKVSKTPSPDMPGDSIGGAKIGRAPARARG